MKTTFDIRSAFVAAISMAAFVAATSSSHATIIDDFTNNSVSAAYSQSIVFTQGPGATMNYNTTTNNDKLTFSFTGANGSAQQATLLRDDFVLAADGESVQLTARIPTTPTGGSPSSLFGGLALHPTTKSLPTPPISSDSSRANLLSLNIDGSGQVIVQTGAAQPFFSAPGTIGINADVVLRFTRLSATSVLPEYSTNGGVSFNPAGGPQTVLGFNALGIYDGNARSSALGTVIFDDLVFNTLPVPEPSTLLLSAFGFVALTLSGQARRGRRR